MYTQCTLLRSVINAEPTLTKPHVNNTCVCVHQNIGKMFIYNVTKKKKKRKIHVQNDLHTVYDWCLIGCACRELFLLG